jgi:hypothetical protein
LTRGDNGNFESIAAELMDESHGSIVGLHAYFRYDMVDQVILAVAESAHCLDLCRVVRVSFGELDTA